MFGLHLYLGGEGMKTGQTVSAPDQRIDKPGNFDWPLANEAEAFIREQAEDFLGNNSFARVLSERMRTETGTDFFEWVDHLVVGPEVQQKLEGLGFARDSKAETPNGEQVYE